MKEYIELHLRINKIQLHRSFAITGEGCGKGGERGRDNILGANRGANDNKAMHVLI